MTSALRDANRVPSIIAKSSSDNTAVVVEADPVTKRLKVDMSLYPNGSELAGTDFTRKYYTNAGAVTDGIIWSPAAGKRWYVTDLILTTSAASTVTIEDDLAAGDSVVFKAELAANSGVSHYFTTPLFSGEDAADLIITTTAGNIYVTVSGYEIQIWHC